MRAEPDISPDVMWIAYQSDRSGRMEVYIERFPELGDRHVVSTDGGWEPQWSANSDKLFYRGLLGMMAVSFDPSSPTPLGSPSVLFEDSYAETALAASYDVAADGRFLMLKPDEQSETGPVQVVLVRNWLEELERLVPTP